MKEEKKVKKSYVKNILCIITCILVAASMILYVIGAVGFKYYGDLNPLFLVLLAVGIILWIAVSVWKEKCGDKAWFSILSILVSVTFAYVFMSIVGDRVYSIAVLLLSDLERDNVEGYYALYTSLGAIVLLFLGIVSNSITFFLSCKKNIE